MSISTLYDQSISDYPVHQYLLLHPMYAEYKGKKYRLVSVYIGSWSNNICMIPAENDLSDDQEYLTNGQHGQMIQLYSNAYHSLDKVYDQNNKLISWNDMINIFYK